MTALYSLMLHDPHWLCAMLALPLVIWLRGRRGAPVLVVPFAASWHRSSVIHRARWPTGLFLGGLVLVIIALARPQRVESKSQTQREGYDLMIAVDLSGSMLAEDFEQNGKRLNRLQAIKPILLDFLRQRTNDRIGMVVFSGRAYTLCPLTFDHEWLLRQVERLKLGMIEDGTAIGDGLGVALTRLEQAARVDAQFRRKGAFVVLMTDGANNRGILTPKEASSIALSRKIPVFTIGAGKDGFVPFPVFDDSGRNIGYRRTLSDLDEGTMREIARETGGEYFRASDIDTAERAFAAIDKTNKVAFQAQTLERREELFVWMAAPGVLLTVIGAICAKGGLGLLRSLSA